MSISQRAAVAKFYNVGIADVNRLTKKEIEKHYKAIENYYKSEEKNIFWGRNWRRIYS